VVAPQVGTLRTFHARVCHIPWHLRCAVHVVFEGERAATACRGRHRRGDCLIGRPPIDSYRQRWEIESTFDELKTHQRGPRTVLCSKSPELVRQEIWGHLCCHYAIRTLMFEAATKGSEDPDRVSFVAALRITRRSLA
jgi:hypothetical protein